MGREPRRSGVARSARQGEGDGQADPDRLRPRSRCTRRPGAVLRGGGASPRALRHAAARLLRQDERLEGTADLRPAQPGAHHVRRHEALRPRRRRVARAGKAFARGLEHEEDAADGEGARRLEPERSAQDYGVRLFATREGSADGLAAGDVGGGRPLRTRPRPRAAHLRPGRRARMRGEERRSLRAAPRAQAILAPARTSPLEVDASASRHRDFRWHRSVDDLAAGDGADDDQRLGATLDGGW